MAGLEKWDFEQFRKELRLRADFLIRDPRLHGRFDESDLVQETLLKAIDPNTPPCQGKTPPKSGFPRPDREWEHREPAPNSDMQLQRNQ